LPRYQRIRHIIRHQILSGELSPGDRLPSEIELARQYRVSRITSSQALSALASEGLVVRQQGKGTFVSPRSGQPRRVAKITGFLEDVVRHASNVSTRLIAFEEIGAPPEVAELLGLRGGAPVRLATRVRLIESQPLTFARNYIRPEWAGYLDASGLESGLTVLELLEKRARLTIDTARQTIQATTADPIAAEMLQVAAGSPLLDMRRLDLSGRYGPIEYVVGYYRADRYMYSVDLIRRRSRNRNFWQHTEPGRGSRGVVGQGHAVDRRPWRRS
jgi:GntR family transcriptional regulator